MKSLNKTNKNSILDYCPCLCPQKAYQTVRSSKVLLPSSERTTNQTTSKATKNDSRRFKVTVSEV